MRGTLRVLRAEAYRVTRTRFLGVTALLLALLAALRVGVARLVVDASHARGVQRALEAGREAPERLGNNAYGPWVDGWLTGLGVGTVLLLLMSARSLAADRTSGVLGLASTRSASRGGLVLGRALLGLPLVLGTVAVTGLGSWIAARALFTFGPLVEHGYELASAAELDGELWRAVAATVPPLCATWAFGLLLSAAARSAALAVGTSLILLLGFDLFKETLGEARHFVFASFNPSFADESCLHEMTGVARGMSDAGYSEAQYMLNLVVPWPEAFVMVLGAWWILSRRTL